MDQSFGLHLLTNPTLSASVRGQGSAANPRGPWRLSSARRPLIVQNKVGRPIKGGPILSALVGLNQPTDTTRSWACASAAGVNKSRLSASPAVARAPRMATLPWCYQAKAPEGAGALAPPLSRIARAYRSRCASTDASRFPGVLPGAHVRRRFYRHGRQPKNHRLIESHDLNPIRSFAGRITSN
jgi:hypothetical protein